MSTRKKTIRKWPVVLFALLILGGLTIVGIAFAKMQADVGDTNDGNMQVAEWNVSIDDSAGSKNLDVTAGNNDGQTYSFLVKNDSEMVTSTYAITVSGIPDNVKVGIDGDDTLHEADSGVVVFTDAGELTAGSSETRTLKFVATFDAEKSEDNPISINVDFTQKEISNAQNP